MSKNNLANQIRNLVREELDQIEERGPEQVTTKKSISNTINKLSRTVLFQRLQQLISSSTASKQAATAIKVIDLLTGSDPRSRQLIKRYLQGSPAATEEAPVEESVVNESRISEPAALNIIRIVSSILRRNGDYHAATKVEKAEREIIQQIINR